MNRKGWIASVAFTTVCLAGIITLLSQASPPPGGRRPARARATTFDPAVRASRGFGDLVPMALEEGVTLELRTNVEDPSAGKAKLRLK